MSANSAEPDRVEQLDRAFVEAVERALRAPEMKRVAERPLQRDPDIVAHREMRGRRRRSGTSGPCPETRHAAGRSRGDVGAVVDDLPGARLEEFRQQVEDRGLARAVRADQRMDRAAADDEVNVAHRGEAAKLLGEPLRLEDRFRQLYHPDAAPGTSPGAVVPSFIRATVSQSQSD